MGMIRRSLSLTKVTSW